MNNKSNYASKDILNHKIRCSRLLVITDEGQKIGPISLKEALELAESKGLDLLLVSNNSALSVAKILDYGKYKYNQKKQDKLGKKRQHIIENKEIRLRTNIGIHDIAFKAKKVRGFIENGSRVKVSLKFRGREVVYAKLGHETLAKFFSYVEDIAEIEKKPKLTNLFLDMYIIPKKNKKVVKTKGDVVYAKNEN